ncbi:MAG TPA: hypothetical protein VG650_14365 [Mycobacteriales bacterium]|nr:hypothetical protein [Mycobacteriales bacterium]
MRRMFYVALGATVGVLVVRKVGQAAQRWTPQGLADQAGGLGQQVSAWWEIVKDQAMVREAELREALGIDEGPGSTAA